MRKLIISFLIVFVLAFSGCGAEGSNNNIKNNPDDDGYEANRALTIEQLYSPENTSFAKMKISSICEDTYCDLYNNGTYPNLYYIVLECCIEDDFYGKLSSGSTVYIPVCLNMGNNAYIEASAVKELFSEYDTVICHFREANDYELISCKSNERQSFSYLTVPCGLDFDILPISDNKVDLQSICTFLDSQQVSYLSYETYGGYTDYIYDGITVDEVSENLRYLGGTTK